MMVCKKGERKGREGRKHSEHLDPKEQMSENGMQKASSGETGDSATRDEKPRAWLGKKIGHASEGK